MKKTVLSLCALLLLSSSAFGFVSTAEIFQRLLYLAAKLEKMETQILFAQVDNINKDTLNFQAYPLESGNSYSIIVIGDEERVKDIDLVVLDENDNIIGKDNDSQNIAVVEVSPKRSGTFKIGVSAYKMNYFYDDAFYGIIVARND